MLLVSLTYNIKPSSIAFSYALFVSYVFAAPYGHSTLEEGIARRCVRATIPLRWAEEITDASNETQVSYSTNCHGAVLTSTPPGKTFDEVTASVVVLPPKTPAGSTYAASAWSASMATLIKAPFSKLVLTLLLQTAKGPMMLGMSDTQITPMTFYRHFC